MEVDRNPFGADGSDRAELWDMLVRRDIDAFLARDWSAVERDFLADRFFGLHAHFRHSSDAWRLDFPTLEIYRDEWLRQAAETAATEYAEPLRPALFRAMNLRDIDLDGDRAVLHKRFDGTVRRADGGVDTLDWKTLYFCLKVEGRWRISSFVGYMPRETRKGEVNA